MIFEYVIQDVKIVLHEDEVPTIRTRSGKKIFRPITSRDLVGFVQDHDKPKVELLYTLRLNLQDATQILASNASIELQGLRDASTGNNILAVVDPAFLQRISTIHMSPENVRHLKHTLLPRLKQVHLAASCKYYSSLLVALHCICCGYCGDTTGMSDYQRYWNSPQGGLSRKTQLQQLARDQSWDMTLSLLHSFTHYEPDKATVTIELQYNLSEDGLAYKRLWRNGVILAEEKDRLRTWSWSGYMKDEVFEDNHTWGNVYHELSRHIFAFHWEGVFPNLR